MVFFTAGLGAKRLELLRHFPIEPLKFFPVICNGHDFVGSEWASLLESGRLREINLPGGPSLP